MPTVNFELRDVPLPFLSSYMSVEELTALESKEITSTLQRHFLHVADILRKCDVPTENLIAALLGAAIQDYVENAMPEAVDKARKADPDLPATLTVLGGFLRAQGNMMTNQGIPASLVGLGLVHAGVVVAEREMSTEKLIENLKSIMEAAEYRANRKK